MTPKVSIILANYNEEKYIAEAIESVINQTYTNWELIIIDDASTDRSQDIINSYKDSRIKTRFCKKNNHVAYASNLGIDMAIGNTLQRLTVMMYGKRKNSKNKFYLWKNIQNMECVFQK